MLTLHLIPFAGLADFAASLAALALPLWLCLIAAAGLGGNKLDLAIRATLLWAAGLCVYALAVPVLVDVPLAVHAGLLAGLYVTPAMATLILRHAVVRQQLAGIGKVILATLLVMLAAIIFRLLHGWVPILFDDQWTHVTIINRILAHGSVDLRDLYMPGQVIFYQVQPWHSFVAALASLFGATNALAAYDAAFIVLQPLLIGAALGLAREVLPALVASRRNIAIGIFCFFAFNAANRFWPAGTAHYQTVNLVLTLLILARLYRGGFAGLPLTVLLIFGMTIIHPIEAYILVLPLAGWALVTGLAFLRRRRRDDFLQAAQLTLACLALVLAGWVTGHFVYGQMAAVFDHAGDYRGFLGYFWSKFWELGGPSVLLLAGISLFSRQLGLVERRAWLYLAGSVIGALVLSALNPWLSTLTFKAVGVELSWRLYYGVQTWLVAWMVLAAQRGRVLKILALVLLLAEGWFWIAFAGPSHLSTNWSDRYAQTRQFPHFYDFVREQQGKIFAGDPFVSAPITAISTNYILVPRPWQVTDKALLDATKAALVAPDLPESQALFCRAKADYIFYLRAPTPDYVAVWQDLGGFLAQFQASGPVPSLPLVGTFDGIDVYRAPQDCAAIVKRDEGR